MSGDDSTFDAESSVDQVPGVQDSHVMECDGKVSSADAGVCVGGAHEIDTVGADGCVSCVGRNMQVDSVQTDSLGSVTDCGVGSAGSSADNAVCSADSADRGADSFDCGADHGAVNPDCGTDSANADGTTGSGVGVERDHNGPSDWGDSEVVLVKDRPMGSQPKSGEKLNVLSLRPAELRQLQGTQASRKSGTLWLRGEVVTNRIQRTFSEGKRD